MLFLSYFEEPLQQPLMFPLGILRPQFTERFAWEEVYLLWEAEGVLNIVSKTTCD